MYKLYFYTLAQLRRIRPPREDWWAYDITCNNNPELIVELKPDADKLYSGRLPAVMSLCPPEVRERLEKFSAKEITEDTPVRLHGLGLVGFFATGETTPPTVYDFYSDHFRDEAEADRVFVHLEGRGRSEVFRTDFDGWDVEFDGIRGDWFTGFLDALEIDPNDIPVGEGNALEIIGYRIWAN